MKLLSVRIEVIKHTNMISKLVQFSRKDNFVIYDNKLFTDPKVSLKFRCIFWKHPKKVVSSTGFQDQCIFMVSYKSIFLFKSVLKLLNQEMFSRIIGLCRCRRDMKITISKHKDNDDVGFYID